MKKIVALLLTAVLFVTALPMTVMAATQYRVGDVVTFGTYEQDNNTKNGPEDIEWIVLEISSDKQSLLLLSRYCLDCVQFNDEYKGVTWEDSYVREWLNDTFYYSAFSSSQRKSLELIYSDMACNPQYGTSGGKGTFDWVTLLSIDEAEDYFCDDTARRCDATAYAKRQGTQVYQTGAWWRLRSPGQLDTGAASVFASGQIAYAGDSVWDYGCGIRPVIKVSIS